MIPTENRRDFAELLFLHRAGGSAGGFHPEGFHRTLLAAQP